MVVEHSYGDQVGNSAIEGRTRPEHDVKDISSLVFGIVVLEAGFIFRGVIFTAGIRGKPLPSWKEVSRAAL